MTLRKAKIEDWQEIASIDQSAWKQNRHSENIADGEHVWRLWVEYAFVGISLEKEEVAGFILAFPTLKNKLFFVHKILIKPEFRGNSHGKKLMRFCNDYADSNNITLRLTTDTNNLAMQKLSAQSGYKKADLIKGYYRANEDRYIFIRQPKPTNQNTI